MADNQIVQIDFQFDLGNVPASTKAFTNYLKGLGVDLKFTKASTDALAQSVAHLATAQTQAAQAGAAAANTVKKSNQQWTNFALILQDLPYGFRGIQNNLPAVVGGFAGMTGPIYLASSAIIAFFTAWDMGVFGATKSTNDWKKALKETNDEIKNTINFTNSEISNLQGLVDVMLDANTTESLRKKALLEVQEAISKVDESEGKKIKTIGDAIIAINLYTEAIQQQQMQEAIGKKIADITIGQIEKRNKLAIETAKANKGIHPLDFFMGNKELDNLNSEIISNETLIRQLEDLRKGNTKALLLNPFSSFNAKGQKNDGLAKEAALAKQRLALEKSTSLEVLQAKQQTYKDDILLYKDYQDQIINLEEQQALEEAKKIGASELTLQNIRDIAIDKRLKSRQDLSAKIQKLIEDDVKAEEKAEKEKERISKEFVQSYNADLKQQSSEFNQFYKTRMDLATGDLAAQKEILLQQRADLEVGLVVSEGLWYGYSKAVGENVKAVADISSKITKEAFDSIMKMGNGIMQSLGPSLDMLLEKGASIGEVLSNAFKSILKQLAKVIIAAAIAVVLISIIFPQKLAAAGGAMKLFGGLVGQGMGIGGLIGGGAGTGASAISAGAGTSAVESVKAGEGVGGQLTAKVSGNDLLFLMNKTQRNNNVSF
jgi:hypothetical protein